MYENVTDLVNTSDEIEDTQRSVTINFYISYHVFTIVGYYCF